MLQILRNLVTNELEDGRLETVLDDWTPSPLKGFYLYYPSRRQMPRPQGAGRFSAATMALMRD